MPFDGRQKQRTLMTKLLSRISHLDELHPLGITNSLDYIEGYS